MCDKHILRLCLEPDWGRRQCTAEPGHERPGRRVHSIIDCHKVGIRLSEEIIEIKFDSLYRNVNNNSSRISDTTLMTWNKRRLLQNKGQLQVLAQ